MKNLTIEAIIQKIFLLLIIDWSVLTGLAMFDGYSRTAVLVVLGTSGLFFFGWFVAVRRRPRAWSKTDGLMMLIIGLIAVSAVVLAHDLPRGRDDAGYLTAAVRIDATGSLLFNDTITRPYHPFRSVGGDTFTSQFLPGYNVALASGYTLAGLPGLLAVNGVLLFGTLSAFYFLARRLGGRRAGWLAVLGYATLYTTLWFTRRTLSENLFTMVIWLAVWCWLVAWQERKPMFLADTLIVLSFLPLVRAEGMVIAVAGLLLVLAHLLRQRGWAVWTSIGAGLVLGGLNLLAFREYGRNEGQSTIDFAEKTFGNALTFFSQSGILLIVAIVTAVSIGLWHWQKKRQRSWPIRRILVLVVAGALLAAEIVWLFWSRQQYAIDWSVFKLQYVGENLILYGLGVFAAILAIAAYRGAIPKTFYLMCLIVLPTFIVLIDPNIAVDQPWFMRRFVPTVIPLLVLGGAIGLAKLVPALSFRRAAAGLIVLNLLVAYPILFWRDNAGVQPQLAALAKQFEAENRTLVLMTPGWDWQQWGYMLNYVYNVDTLPNLDGFDEAGFRSLLARYDQVYVMALGRSAPFPHYNPDNLTLTGTWDLRYPFLEPTMWLTGYVDDNRRALELARLQQGQKGSPPRQTSVSFSRFSIYRVIDPTALTWNPLAL